jgi:hypothetical protein
MWCSAHGPSKLTPGRLCRKRAQLLITCPVMNDYYKQAEWGSAH